MKQHWLLACLLYTTYAVANKSRDVTRISPQKQQEIQDIARDYHLGITPAGQTIAALLRYKQPNTLDLNSYIRKTVMQIHRKQGELLYRWVESQTRKTLI